MRHHLSKRDQYVDKRGAPVDDPHALNLSRPQTAAQVALDKTTTDSLLLDAKLTQLQDNLQATLKKSLSSDAVFNTTKLDAGAGRAGFRLGTPLRLATPPALADRLPLAAPGDDASST